MFTGIGIAQMRNPRAAHYLVERGTRLELATNCLEGSDSTTELPPRNPRILIPGARLVNAPTVQISREAALHGP